MVEEVSNESVVLSVAKAVFNVKYMRFIVLAIIGILTALGIIMIIFGNIALLHYHQFAYFYEDGEMAAYITPSALCIFVGSALLILAGFGCYGSLKNSTCAVNTFAFILSIMLIFELVALGMTYTFDRASIWIIFEIPIWGIASADIRAQIDFIQRSLGCCGTLYFTDFRNHEFPSDMATVKITRDQQMMVVPASCCKNSNVVEGYCANIWEAGCKIKLMQEMEHNVMRVGVIMACAMFINLLGMMFAVVLAQSIRKMKSEKALLRWTIQEEVIVGRDPESSASHSGTNTSNSETGSCHAVPGPGRQLEAGSSGEPKPGPSREPQPGPSREPQPGPSREPKAGPSRPFEGRSRPPMSLFSIEDVESDSEV